MLVLAISAAGALVVFLLLCFFVKTRIVPETQMHQRLKKLKYGVQMQTERATAKTLSDIPFVERTIAPLFRSIAQFLLLFAPKGIHERIERRIMLAGKQGVWSVSAFVCGWVLSVAVCLLLAFYFLSGVELPFVQRVALLVLGGVMGALLPFAVLNSIIRERQKQILRQLPEFLDLLCVSVQAGLSFDSGIAKIVDRMKGPFVEECQRMQRDVRMGMMRKHSLQQMARRCDVQEVYLFTTSIIQAERLGTSIANTLVEQANNMRERRRQAAKAEALRAPVKIVFPLVLFIFPALFVIVLLPSLLFLLKNM